MASLRFFRSLVARALGLPGIYLRLDQLDAHAVASTESRYATDRVIEALRTDFDETLRGSGDDQSQLIMDLRAEMVAQGDFAVERAVEVAQRIVAEVQSQLIMDLRAEMVAQGDFAVERAAIAANLSGQALRSQLTSETASIRRILRSLEATAERSLEGAARPTVPPSRNGPLESPPSHMYAAIEDVFRGESEAVGLRQVRYVQLLEAVTASSPLLDLGCGRGEWLQELSLKGIPSSGVDSNELFVEQCRTAGLDVEHGDIFERIRRQPNESLGAVTLFQVLEHLPFMLVVEVLGEACRALVPGGLLIAEVPNAKNLRVGSGTFWIDPTHERPWYPDLLEFLARQAGFAEVSGEYVNPLAPEPDLADLPTSVRGVVSALHEAINGPADYALMARR